MSARAFGMAALGDPGFVAGILRGRSPRLVTVDRALAFMGEAPVGRAFRAEVEAFLEVTRIKRSALGRAATGNPSFVAQLRGGLSPTLTTVGRVRAWMGSHASKGELRAVRDQAGPPPSVLPEDFATAGALSPECPSRFGATNTAAQHPCGVREYLPLPPDTTDPLPGAAYVSTAEAAVRLGLSPRTLDRYRATGRGPAFHRFGGVVRYSGEDLAAWAAARQQADPRAVAGGS